MKIVKKSAFAFVLSLSAGLCASDNKTKAAAGASANTGLNAGLLVTGTAAEHHYGDGSAAAGATSGGVAQRSSLWGDRRAGLGASTMSRADDVVARTILFESRGAQLSPASDMQERVSTLLRGAIAKLEADPTRWEAIQLDLAKSLIREGCGLIEVCFGTSPIGKEEDRRAYGVGCLDVLDRVGLTVFGNVGNPNVAKVGRVYRAYLKCLMQSFVDVYGDSLFDRQKCTLNEVASDIGVTSLRCRPLPDAQKISDESLAKFGSEDTTCKDVSGFLSSLQEKFGGVCGDNLFAPVSRMNQYFYENFVNPLTRYRNSLGYLLREDDPLLRSEKGEEIYFRTFSYIAHAFKAACEVFGEGREDDRVNFLRDCFEFVLRDLIRYSGRCFIDRNEEHIRELDAECIEQLITLTHTLTLNGCSLEAIFREEFAAPEMQSNEMQGIFALAHVVGAMESTIISSQVIATDDLVLLPEELRGFYESLGIDMEWVKKGVDALEGPVDRTILETLKMALEDMESTIKEYEAKGSFLQPEELGEFYNALKINMRWIMRLMVMLQNDALLRTEGGSLGASASGSSSAGATSRGAPLPLRRQSRQSVEGASGVDHRTEAGDVPGVDHRNRSLLGVSLGSNWGAAAVAAVEDSDEDSADAAAGESFGKNSRSNRSGISKSFAPSHERK